MSEGDQKKYGAVAAVNMLFGVVNFIVLSLPLEWRLIASSIPPDVDRMTVVNGVRWAVEGRARSGIATSDYGAKLEVESVEGDKSKQWENTILINGHKGYYRLKRRTIGIFRKKEVEVIEVNFYCDVTRRTLNIRIEGPGLHKYANDLINAMKASICH